MVDLAVHAYNTKHYELAADIYERNIRDHGPSLQLYLGLADSFAKCGQFKKAFETYIVAFRLGKVKPEHLKQLISALLDVMGQPENSTESKTNKCIKQIDPFECELCLSVWIEPVTLPCGHTYCRRCLERETSRTCKTCGTVKGKTSGFSNNILLSQTVEKWFEKEAKAAKLKARGNAQFEKKLFAEAVELYTQAIEFTPTDHLLVSNRSYAYAVLNKYSQALQDAELATELRPDWPKAHFRKATALVGLRRYEDAALAYLQCLSLDSSIATAQSGLAEIIHHLLKPKSRAPVKHSGLQSDSNPSALEHIIQHVELLTKQKFPPAQILTDNIEKLQESLPSKGDVPAESSSSKQSCVVPPPCSSASVAATATEAATLAEDESIAAVFKHPTLKPCDPNTSKSHSQPNSPTNSPALPSKRSRCFSDASDKEPSKKSHVEQTAENASSIKSITQAPRNTLLVKHDVASSLTEKDDFECSLCYRLLYQPVTTPCGHTFCRMCLDRSLDHTSICPLCKGSLAEYLAERRQSICFAVEQILELYFAEDYKSRRKVHEEEVAAVASMGVDEHEVPIFVCTSAFPSVACPLHIFEPRYRLMIRMCMESGLRQFGMCLPPEDDSVPFSNFGCMLEIRDVQYFPDGRSVADTIGGRRFRVNSRNMKDGYDMAKVEFLKDIPPLQAEKEEVTQLHTEIHRIARDWIDSLPDTPRQRILNHFGEFPELEPNFMDLPNGPTWTWWLTAFLPLDPRAQLSILAMTSLKERLVALKRVLRYVSRRQGMAE